MRALAASGTNNSRLVDDNTAQQLKHEEIEQMKLDGRGGRAIVDAVVKNSATYADKTEYAKEKYVRKKQKKYACHTCPTVAKQVTPHRVLTFARTTSPRRHLVIVTVLRPSARTLCQAAHARDPKKIGCASHDTARSARQLILIKQPAPIRYLRVDGLGLMLTKVGVRAHSKIVVFEEGVGLLTSAVAERLGGTQ